MKNKKNKNPQFSKEDIKKIALAIMELWKELDNSDYTKTSGKYYCSFCGEYEDSNGIVKHENECSVLSSMDILSEG
jgi:hypothetical protein